MLIGEVVEKTEVSKKTLYFYEEQGLIQPEIQENGYRDYSEKDVQKIKTIIMLRSIEMTIADIKLYFSDVTKEKELLEKYAKLIDEEQEELSEKKSVCHRLLANDIRSYVESKKNIGTFEDVYYPYEVGVHNTSKSKKSGFLALFIISILVGYWLHHVGTPLTIIIIFCIIFYIILIPMIFTLNITCTEDGIYYFKNAERPIDALIMPIKLLLKKETDTYRIFVPYDEIIDAEVRWLKEPTTPRWTVPKVWVEIHTKKDGIFVLDTLAYNGIYKTLPTVMTILSEHEIPIFDPYRIIGALEENKNLSEYIDYLIFDLKVKQGRYN